MNSPAFRAAVVLIFGILCGMVWPWKSPGLVLICLSGLSIGFSLSLIRRDIAYWIFLLAGIFCLGISLESIENQKLSADWPAGSQRIVGIVTSAPALLPSEFGEKRVRFRFEVGKVLDFNLAVPLEVWVNAPQLAHPLEYGERLLLEGEFRKVTGPRNPGGFDAQTYLKASGIAGKFSVRRSFEVVRLSRDHGNKIFSAAFRLKEKLARKIDQSLPAPERNVLKAVLLGDQAGLDWSVRDPMAKSGTSHLLAVSGGNIGFIAFLCMALLRAFRFRPRAASFGTLLFVVAYGGIVGPEASVLRGTVMASMFLLAHVLGREGDLFVALSWSALAILVWRPFQILDPGFQLSFVTVFFLIHAWPAWKEWSLRFSEKFPRRFEFVSRIERYFTHALGVSLIAFMAAAPLVAKYFFLFSPISILSNLIAVPFFSLVASSGVSLLSLGILHPALSEILASSAWFFTRAFVAICRWFASVPFGYFRVAPFSPLGFLGYYALLFLIFRRGPFLKIHKELLVLILLVAGVLSWKAAFHSPSKNLRLTFLDVGHGDACFLQWPDGRSLLVDCGSGGTWDQGRSTIAPFLWSQGLTRLDAILITHPHFDHYGGLKYLLDEFKVGAVMDNGNRQCEEYEKIFENRKVRRIALARDVKIGSGSTFISVVHPPRNWAEDDSAGPNDQSVVLRIPYGKIGILLAGDAEKSALNELLKRTSELKSAILKVPHHGGYNGLASQEFFSQTAPEVAILSEAERNRFHLPRSETVESLSILNARIYQTGLCGAIQLETDGSTYTIRSYLPCSRVDPLPGQ